MLLTDKDEAFPEGLVEEASTQLSKSRSFLKFQPICYLLHEAHSESPSYLDWCLLCISFHRHWGTIVPPTSPELPGAGAVHPAAPGAGLVHGWLSACLRRGVNDWKQTCLGTHAEPSLVLVGGACPSSSPGIYCTPSPTCSLPQQPSRWAELRGNWAECIPNRPSPLGLRPQPGKEGVSCHAVK